MKRIIDFAISLFALILIFLPMLVPIYLLVRFHDGGPALYSQTRVGKGGRVFRLWKFRSMVVNADKIGGYSTSRDDARITPIGGFLRRSSLDEIPQLWNVLVGDMSLVGPRPNVPAQRADYTQEEWDLRNRVRPGITGLAQVMGRSSATPEGRLACDLEYVARHGVLRDLVIIWRTMTQVLSRGEY